MSQDRLEMTQDRPKMYQDRPETGPRLPKSGIGSPNKDPDRSQAAQPKIPTMIYPLKKSTVGAVHAALPHE